MTTNPRRSALSRVALGVAGLALTAASLTACGGDDDTSDASASTSPSASESADASPSPSDDASEETAGAPSGDFCGIYGDLFQDVTEAMSAGGNGDFSKVAPKLKDYAARLKEAGIPDDAPAEAKQGFEVSLQAIEDLPDNPTQQDLLAAGEGASAEEQASTTAFGQYVITACPDLVPTAAATPAS